MTREGSVVSAHTDALKARLRQEALLFYKPDLTELNGAFGKCILSARLHHYKDKLLCMDRKKANSETHVSAGQMLARVIRCFEKCQNEANVLK